MLLSGEMVNFWPTKRREDEKIHYHVHRHKAEALDCGPDVLSP